LLHLSFTGLERIIEYSHLIIMEMIAVFSSKIVSCSPPYEQQGAWFGVGMSTHASMRLLAESLALISCSVVS
jgi:hypothetical protein